MTTARMHVRVDPRLCEAHALCVEIAPRFSSWVTTSRPATSNRLKRCATAWRRRWPPVRARPSAPSPATRQRDALRFPVPGKGIDS